VPTHRHAISVEATQRELRLCGFALLNHYLTMHQVMAEHVQLPPVEMLILIATTTGNVQRALRPASLPQALRGSEPLPPELVVPMSRRAIARVTGLPTETVRRHVDRMVERGILVSMPKGVLAPSRLTEGWVAAAVLRLLESHAACTEELLALQAIAAQAPRSDRAKRA
jgi:Winged helix-turn-helix DNA-binding